MVSDETIRKAAEVLLPVMDEHSWVLWGTCECGLDLDVKHGTYRQSYKAHEADVAARALAEAGLLAPAPMREEWAARYVNGGGAICRTRDEAEAELDRMTRDSHRHRVDEPPAPEIAGIYTRHVTAWEPVEGDGRADQ